jgi:hypothetical protein
MASGAFPAAPPQTYQATPQPQTGYVQPGYAAPPPQYPPSPPPAAPPRPAYVIPPPRQGLPSWVVVLIVAAILIGAGWAGIRLLSPPRSGDGISTAKEEPAKADAKQEGAARNPFAKHLELTGFRAVENARKRLEVQMVVINHSAADLPPLKLRVTLRVANDPNKEISTFQVSVPGLSAYGVQDLRTETTSKLRAYEFPDWQFLKADFEVVSP